MTAPERVSVGADLRSASKHLDSAHTLIRDTDIRDVVQSMRDICVALAEWLDHRTGP